MLEHGGRLLQAARRYRWAPEQMLDLSTGINPIPWQGLVPSAANWNRLPEEEDGLIEAAHSYYGVTRALAVSGSQAAIQTLPRLRSAAQVGVLAPSYNEHAHQWRQAGHKVVLLQGGDRASERIRRAADELGVVILCNPNNPTGEHFGRDELLDWHARLSRRGGWLVVDEAFTDTTPEASLVHYADRDGLIVLRSLGKFFGLAGARVGFVMGTPPLLRAVAEWVGPWTISGPARAVAKAALADRTWQESARQRLPAESSRLAALLSRQGLPPSGGCALFQWTRTSRAAAIHEGLALKGILTRRFESPPSLRFGLPATEADWQRLEAALHEVLLSKDAA